MPNASIPSPSHQTSTNNYQQGQGQQGQGQQGQGQQGQGQQSNQAPRVGGQSNNDNRPPGMQRSGLTYNPRDTYLLFPPAATGVRPPKSDITQYQDQVDRAQNKPQVSGGQSTNRSSDNTSNAKPNPLIPRYWACCQGNCEDRGGGCNLTELHTSCHVCDHLRCCLCPTGMFQYNPKRE